MTTRPRIDRSPTRAAPSSAPAAAARVATVWGVFAALGGLTHAVGEILQGPVAPAGVVFDSWTTEPMATHLGGEPALSVIPNLLLTGVACLLVSLALGVWAARFVRRRHGGAVLLALSVALLLLGGGFGPPLLGLLAGVAGLAAAAPGRGWRARFAAPRWRPLSRAWPPLYWLCLLATAFLVVGSVLLGGLLGVNAPDLFVGAFLASVLLLIPTVVGAIARDARGAGGRAPRRATA